MFFWLPGGPGGMPPASPMYKASLIWPVRGAWHRAMPASLYVQKNHRHSGGSGKVGSRRPPEAPKVPVAGSGVCHWRTPGRNSARIHAWMFLTNQDVRSTPRDEAHHTPLKTVQVAAGKRVMCGKCVAGSLQLMRPVLDVCCRADGCLTSLYHSAGKMIALYIEQHVVTP